MKDPLEDFHNNKVLQPFLETKDPDILKEIEALNAGLKFSSYSADEEFLLNDLDLKLYNRTGWPAPYAIVNYLLTKAYYEHRAWEAFVGAYKQHYWPVSGYIHTFVEHVLNDGRADLVEKVWRGVVETSKQRFLACLPDRERYGDLESVTKNAQSRKQNAIDAYNNLIAFYAGENRIKNAKAVEKERDIIINEDFKKPLGPPLKMKMDEGIFWQIISEVKEKAGPMEERRFELMTRLEALSGPDIRKFHSLYAKTMKRLYHWEVWALAYAAQGGCSDDAFHDFRAWLILQGDVELIDLAISAPHQAAKRIDKDPDLIEGGWYTLISAAYLARTGKLLNQIMTDLATPKGKEWDEDAIESSYPELVKIYGPV